MRYMILVKASEGSEEGYRSNPALEREMDAYNEALVKAGVRLAVGGLKPSSAGHRIIWTDGVQRVVDGPFAETKELIAGFFILEVKSHEEALEWAKRCPRPHDSPNCEIELRPFYEAADLQ